MTFHQPVKTLTFGSSAEFRHFSVAGTEWFEAGEITRILFPHDQAFGAGFYGKMTPDQIVSTDPAGGGGGVKFLPEPTSRKRKLLSVAGIHFLIERSRAEIARHSRPQAADPERNWEFEMWLDDYLASLPKPDPEQELLPAPTSSPLVLSRLSVDLEHPASDRPHLIAAWNALVQRTFTQGVEVKGIAVQYLEGDQAA